MLQRFHQTEEEDEHIHEAIEGWSHAGAIVKQLRNSKIAKITNKK